ncbi:zinc-binding dehydrogenase [Saccharopolyspora sp. 5N708]|uniref:zinc-binding dehydrogenase n=1 Tax=Saccharopolyspora sp. 5N708 TaxID=3457424 RepID=UPI003FD57466
MGAPEPRLRALDTLSRQVVLTAADGDPKSLLVRRFSRPVARRGRVVVRTEAAGVSFAEVQMLRGLHPFPPRPPFVPGYDLVGEIVEVGPGVTGWAVGDRVAAMPRSGAWQEHVEVPAAILARVPAALDAGEAVALVCNGVTAWQMLHRSARVAPGETVLVQGASGGVGSVLTRLAVHHGARVIGTASPHKHDAVRAMGATPVDYRGELPAAVRALAPDGVDAVFDHIGGRSVSVGWRLLAPGGRLVSFDSSVEGFAPGQWFRPHVPVLRKVAGWTLARAIGATRGRVAKTYYVRPGAKFRRDIEALYDLVGAGVLQPHVDGWYPLEQAADALCALRDGQAVGKLVLVP